MTRADTKLRLDFAKRLIEALAFAGIDDSPTTLAHHFNTNSFGMFITMHGARRWLLLGQGSMLEEPLSIESTHASNKSNISEVLGIFQSLKDSEQQLVWNLMMKLNRSHGHST